MIFSLPTLLFYVFSAVVVLSALMVISSKNPVHSVLFLILAFFNSAGLFVLLGAEYIAMTLVIVYVGAVMVLFLFVIMMLDINFAQLREGFLRYLPIGAAVAGLLFVELFAVIKSSVIAPGHIAKAAQPIPNPMEITNTHAIGAVLYTQYAYLFQVAGLILLVAMIGAIVLTHRERSGVKKQNVVTQVNRSREASMRVVKVKTGEGIQ